jgi:hypothetical protein
MPAPFVPKLILVLNYPESGRFTLVEADKGVDDVNDAIQYIRDTEWTANGDDILMESDSDTPFQFYVDYQTGRSEEEETDKFHAAMEANRRVFGRPSQKKTSQ